MFIMQGPTHPREDPNAQDGFNTTWWAPYYGALYRLPNRRKERLLYTRGPRGVERLYFRGVIESERHHTKKVLQIGRPLVTDISRRPIRGAQPKAHEWGDPPRLICGNQELVRAETNTYPSRGETPSTTGGGFQSKQLFLVVPRRDRHERGHL